MKAFAKKKLDFALSSVRKHMKEEGENLKRLLENNESHNQAVDATS